MKPYFLIPLLLAGCVSAEQAARNRAAQAEQHRQAEIAYTRGLFSQCRQIGYPEGSEGLRNCVLQLHNQNQANRAALGAAALGAAIQQQNSYRPIVPQPRTPTYTNCTRDPWGNVHCTTQ